jgi:hypothetical protein
MSFEEYIKDRKELLHTETPPAAIWQHIENHYTPAKKQRRYWVAAACFLLVAAGSVFLLIKNAGNDHVPNDHSATLPPVLPVTKQPDTRTIPKPVFREPGSANTTNSVSLINKKVTTISKAPSLAKAGKTEKKFFYNGQDFYDSLLIALKQRIEATPVKWVEEDYFKIYTTEYKNLELQERAWRNQIVAEGSKPDYIIGLIQINQRKLVVLDNLLKQINNINNKKGDTARIQNKKIII